MISVLHVLAPGPVGGAEGVVRGLAAGHHGMGHRSTVAAVVSEEAARNPLLTSLAEAGVPTAILRIPARAYLREQRAIASLVARLSPHVVHTHGYRADVVDGAVARRLGVPVVSTVHGFTGNGWRNRLYERLQLRSLRGFDAVVAVSAPLQDRLTAAGVLPERIRLVRNAPSTDGPLLERDDARRCLGAPDGALHLGWVGRLSPEKGVDLFLDALAELDDLPVVASILGGGAERARGLDRARRLGLDDKVRWHGAVPRAARLFRGFDLLVLSSRTEGTPLVLLEAMAAGVPVVATRVGGVPDVVSEEEGFLVEPDDPAALAAAIRRAHRDPTDARSRAARARRACASRFDPETWLLRHLEIYAEVAGLPAVPPSTGRAPATVPTPGEP